MDLKSTETFQATLDWIANSIQQAIQNGDPGLTFTFVPGKQNNLDELFTFILKLRSELKKYGFTCWCILSTKEQAVRIKIMT